MNFDYLFLGTPCINDFQNSSNLLSFILFTDDTSVFFHRDKKPIPLYTVNTDLSHILFLIYINDIINSSQLFTYSLFADDTCLLYSHKNIHTLMQSVNTEICKLFAWFCCNKLLLNTGKTKCVLFRSRGRKIPNSVNPLVVGGQQINRSQHVQFLGVTVDEYLSWKEHLDNVCTKVSRSVGAYVERVGDGSGRGNGEGAGTGAHFRDKPPRLSRKGGLRAGRSINAPIRDNRGLFSKGCVE